MTLLNAGNGIYLLALIMPKLEVNTGASMPKVGNGIRILGPESLSKRARKGGIIWYGVIPAEGCVSSRLWHYSVCKSRASARKPLCMRFSQIKKATI